MALTNIEKCFSACSFCGRKFDIKIVQGQKLIRGQVSRSFLLAASILSKRMGWVMQQFTLFQRNKDLVSFIGIMCT